MVYLEALMPLINKNYTFDTIDCSQQQATGEGKEGDQVFGFGRSSGQCMPCGAAAGPARRSKKQL